MSLALLDVGFIAVTGKSLREPALTPKPTCYEDLERQWATEPIPLDEVAQFDLYASRAEQSAECGAQLAAWIRTNFGGESEVG